MIVKLKEEYNSPYNIDIEDMANGYATFTLEQTESELWTNQKVDNTFSPNEED